MIVIPKIDGMYLAFSVVVFYLRLKGDILLHGKMNLWFELNAIKALDGMHVRNM